MPRIPAAEAAPNRENDIVRKFLIAIAGLVVVLAAVAVYFVVNIDMVVKSRIERTGSRIAQVPVTVGSVDISLASRTATLNDLVIANPPGFSVEPAVRLGSIVATIDVGDGSITNVRATEPSIRVEGPAGRTNIDVLRGNARASAGPASGPGGSAGGAAGGAGSGDTQPTAGSPGNGEAAEEDGEDEEDASETYVIHAIEIERPRATVHLEGMDEAVALDIDRLEFRDLAGTRSEIARQLLDQLTADVKSEVRARMGEVAAEAIRAELEMRSEELKGRARDALNRLLE